MTASADFKVRLTELGHCPSCGVQRPVQPLYELRRTRVYRCPCGLEYLDPSLDAHSMMEIYLSSETLKEINPACGHYYEYDASDEKTLTSREYRGALEAAGRLTGGRELLEIGCGAGGFLDYAKRKGWNPSGLDSSADNIARVKARGIEGRCADFLTVPAESRYDVVVLWDLIEHPQDPGALLEKSAAFLKPQGVLLVATPCYPNLLSLLAGLFYRITGGRMRGAVERLYFLEHTTYLGPGTLRALLERHGFTIRESWKGETDLARYGFTPFLRTLLGAAFLAARPLGLQNRLLVAALKTR